VTIRNIPLVGVWLMSAAYASIYLSSILSIYLSIYLYIYIYISVSIYLYLYLSIYLYLSVYLSIHIHTYITTHAFMVSYFSCIIFAHKVHRPLYEKLQTKNCCSQNFNVCPCAVLSRNVPIPGQDVWWACRSVSAQ